MTIERMKKGNWGKIRAFFDLQTEDGFTIKGFKLIEGINGLFVGYPSQKGSDEEYHDTVWADKELRSEVEKLALEHYETQSDDAFNDIPGAFDKEKTANETKQTIEESETEDIPF
jgi:DNA-binding cell septation regulator SpoVG